MKLATEYLSDAAKFERLADTESDPKLREQFAQQAAAYRKLAADRAKALGIPSPSSDQPPTDGPSE